MGSYESIISKVVELREELSSLELTYLDVIACLEREHAEIKVSNLDSIKLIVEEKTEFGNVVHTKCERLGSVFESLKLSAESFSTESSSITDYSSLIDRLKSLASGSELGKKVLNHEQYYLLFYLNFSEDSLLQTKENY